MHKVLYLDFDGVLHPADARIGPRGPFLGSPPGHCLFEHAALLANLLEAYPDVRIVLSTSWAERGYEYARRRLPAELADRCIGSTFHTKMDLAVWRAMSRGEQVLADVRRRQPNRWLAIDDLDEGWGRYRDNVVITCPVYGISSTSVHAQLVERLKVFRDPAQANPPAQVPSGARPTDWGLVPAPAARASKGFGAPTSAHPDESSRSSSGRTWNYRVIRFDHKDEVEHAIHEVHYRDGQPIAYSAKPATFSWFNTDSAGAPQRLLQRIAECLEKPILTASEIGDSERFETKEWGSGPAVGTERFWKPSVARIPFKKRLELKKVSRAKRVRTLGSRR